MLLSGRSMLFALTRSTSSQTCGTFARKLVNFFAKPSVGQTLIIRRRHGFDMSARRVLPRHERTNLYPPALPMPDTGGGGKAITRASGISARTRVFIFARIAGRLCSRAFRAERSLHGRNTAAGFG